jgi:hypothetical protein
MDFVSLYGRFFGGPARRHIESSSLSVVFLSNGGGLVPPLSTATAGPAVAGDGFTTHRKFFISVRSITIRILILVIDFSDGVPSRVDIPVARGGGEPQLQPEQAALDDGPAGLLRRRRRRLPPDSRRDGDPGSGLPRGCAFWPGIFR